MFFVSSPAFHEVHLAEHCVACADVLIEACSIEGKTLAHGFVAVCRGPFQSRLDLMALRWIRSVGWAANARKLGRAKPRLGAMTTNHVSQGADSPAGLIMQRPQSGQRWVGCSSQ